jgi:hypothetical protein
LRTYPFALTLGLALLSFHAGAQTPAGSEDQKAAEYGEAQHFVSPALLDDLSQRFWDLEDETSDGLRVKVGADAVVGLVHGSHVRAHAVVGPALSLQLSKFGRAAKRHSVLARRTESLQGQPTARFKLLLAQECTRTKRVLSELRRRLLQTRHDLDVLQSEAKLAAVPEAKLAPQGLRIASCNAPAAVVALAPDADADAALRALDATNQTRRRAFLLDVDKDLLDRLAAANSDLEFLQRTERRSEEVFDQAERVLRETNLLRSRFFVEGYLGYVFQASGFGVYSELGGLTTGLGVGWGPLSLGAMYVEPRRFGAYIALSVKVFD